MSARTHNVAMSKPVTDELRSSQHAEYLQAMGIQRWVARKDNLIEETLDETQASDSVIIPVENSDWTTLRQQVTSCTLCELHKARTQTVFGTGDQQADWLIIGEAPGKDEDQQGEPFVGRAGQLLNAMLKAVGLQRSEVYIANILKCRPPDNRDPKPVEAACCEAYLAQQIRLINPKLILTVGRIATQSLLKTDTPIGKLRNTIHHYGEQGIPVVATYHPAYLLRSPLEKRKAWDDLQLARSLLNQTS